MMVLRRWWFLARIRALARWNRARVDVQIDPTARVAGHITVVISPATTTILRVGASSSIAPGVLLRLKGGELLIGPHCEIRRGVNLSVGGKLVLAEQNMISWGTMVHCDDLITFAARSFTSEYCTITDSSHAYTLPGSRALENLVTAPVSIGEDTWICAKATITKGVTIGNYCVIAANSMVIDDVAGGQIASGVPATAVAATHRPWT